MIHFTELFCKHVATIEEIKNEKFIVNMLDGMGYEYSNSDIEELTKIREKLILKILRIENPNIKTEDLKYFI